MTLTCTIPQQVGTELRYLICVTFRTGDNSVQRIPYRFYNMFAGRPLVANRIARYRKYDVLLIRFYCKLFSWQCVVNANTITRFTN